LIPIAEFMIQARKGEIKKIGAKDKMPEVIID